MERFIDKLANRIFDFNKEIQSIEELLNKEDNYGYSLHKNINHNFLRWNLRNNYISYGKLRSDMGIFHLILKAKENTGIINIDEFIYYCEFILNILNIPNVTNYVSEFYCYIVENIKNILIKFNYEIINFEEGIKIFEKDFMITEVGEIVQDTYNLGEQLYLYKHHSLKGRLNEKADTLCRLYKYFEGIEKTLKSNNLTNLASDIGFMVDKLDVRHKPDKREVIVLKNMSKEEQEKWYDELFNLYLSAIILANNIEKRKDIEELKKKFINGN